MTTSKQDKKNRFFKEKWGETKLRLDANPRRTAIWMAVILFAVFCFFVYRFADNLRSPKEKKQVELIRTVQRRFSDSISVRKSVVDDISEYFELLEIQRELEEMKENPDRIDTARVEQLIRKLNK
ncbi:MAG: hypothetical protein LBJ72_10340 [Dysgonamonadaceae bacterium]|jgi:cell shape-determining protein MreC|nr:hypothetical protein [Dysgonamonadaceae bacterium]